MHIESSGALLQLPGGATLRLQAARGLLLAGRAGRLWVTEEGFSQDVFLHAFESYLVRGNGRVVVSADTEAALALQPGPAGRGAFQLIAALLQGPAKPVEHRPHARHAPQVLMREQPRLGLHGGLGRA